MGDVFNLPPLLQAADPVAGCPCLPTLEGHGINAGRPLLVVFDGVAYNYSNRYDSTGVILQS